VDVEADDGHRRQRAAQEVPAGDRRGLRLLMIRGFRHDNPPDGVLERRGSASLVKKLSRG
jgi:hypothetical protein